MRRAIALLVGLAAITCGLIASPTPGRAQSSPAARALCYLQSTQKADGSIPSSFSDAPTEDTVIAAAAAGYDPNAFRNGNGADLITYLRGRAQAATEKAGQADKLTAGEAGKLTQAAVAAKLDPRLFGGVDLIAAIYNDYNDKTGSYGNGQTFTQTLALLGLEAARIPTPPAALQYLRRAQDSDGGWNYKDVPDDPVGSDTNSTAMALMALDAAGDHSADAPALAWLRRQQQPNGGFPYQAPGASDPDSDALVVQGIIATRVDPTGSTWLRGPHGDLLGLQDGTGGFGYGGAKPDPFTTSQVPIALLLQAFPAASRWLPGAALDCGPIPPSPAPTSPPASAPSPAPVRPPSAPFPAVTPSAVNSAGSDSGGGAPATPGAVAVTTPSATAGPVSAATPSPSPTPTGGARGVAASPIQPAQPGGDGWGWLAFLAVGAVACLAVVGIGALILRTQR